MAATKTVAHRLRLRKSRVPEILAAKPHLAISPRRGVITPIGYGIQVRVDRGHLILEDGIGADRRYARLSRLGHGLKRLVVIGAEGMVSLAAFRWLSDQDAALVMLDRTGKVLATAGPSRKLDARIRRAQGVALQSGTGLRIARELINQKLICQERVTRAQLQNAATADAIGGFRSFLSLAETFERIRLLESKAGAAYWSAWKALPITFPTKDILRVPAHWQRFQNRISLIAGKSPRLGINPPNAMLNYLYAVLESEAQLAAAALRLDPALGFLHADIANRDSLTFDLMEPVRPLVDAFVLGWIARETLKRDWFFEERSGICRLIADLASRLSETASTWRDALAPIAEFVARSLRASAKQLPHERGPGTHLTQQHRREANNVAFAPPTTRRAKSESHCQTCGIIVTRGRKFCAACGIAYSTENINRAAGKGRTNARAPESRSQHSKTARLRATAQWRWDAAAQPPWLTPEFFAERVQPLLVKLTVASIASTISVSRFYAGEIRRGNRIPHPRHWVDLGRLVGISSGSDALVIVSPS